MCIRFCKPDPAYFISQIAASRQAADRGARPPASGIFGCCGAGVILQGFGQYFAMRMLGTRPQRWQIARAAVCAGCKYRTFLDNGEWTAKKIAQIRDKLQGKEGRPLPIDHEPAVHKSLYCSICTCFIEAAILAKNKRCDLGLWDKIPTNSLHEGQTDDIYYISDGTHKIIEKTI